MRGRSVRTLNHQNLSIERQRVRGANRLTSKPQPPRAKARWGRCVMRSACIVAACVGLALLVGGCDPTRDSRYLREGIGTDLYWDGLPAATQLQDIYLANICAQAISPTARSVDPISCDGLSLRPRDWGLLVQAGMNDIDLRCDAYLAWLYDRKSSKEPFLKELASLGGAAAGILRATNAGQTPIALTAIAFGMAADAFTNIDLRLVNAVDYTTVDSLVRDNRTQFRHNNIDLVIDNRPAAIYVLRNYLSICVPDSIEMSINNTVTVYHRAGPDALRVPPIGLRMAPATAATSAAVRGADISDVRRQLPGEGYHPDVDRQNLFNSQLERSLCAPQTGQSRELAIRDYLAGQNQLQDPSVTSVTLTPGMQRLLTRAVARVPDCSAAGFENAFEVGRYGVYDSDKRKANINSLQDALRTKLGLSSTVLPDSDDISKTTRDAIEQFRIKKNVEKDLKGQVSNRLLVELRKPDSK
jgi:hypothetical protein